LKHICLTFHIPSLSFFRLSTNQLLHELDEREDIETRVPDGDREDMMENFDTSSWGSSSFDDKEPAEIMTGVIRPHNVDAIFRFRSDEKLPHATSQSTTTRDVPFVSPCPENAIGQTKTSPKPAARDGSEGTIGFDWNDYPAKEVVPFDFTDFPDDLLLREVSTFCDAEMLTYRPSLLDTTEPLAPRRQPSTVDLTDSDEDADTTTGFTQHQYAYAGGESGLVSPNIDPLYTPQGKVSMPMSPPFHQSSIVQTEFGPAILMSTEQTRRPVVSLGKSFTPRTPPTARTTTTDYSTSRRFSEEEDMILRHAIDREGESPYNWKRIAARYFSNTRSSLELNNRWFYVRQQQHFS
jgi:hypothetical protein